jgi:hypothetical protein
LPKENLPKKKNAPTDAGANISTEISAPDYKI